MKARTRRSIYLLGSMMLAMIWQSALSQDDFFAEFQQPAQGAASGQQYRGQLRPVNYTVLSAGIDGILKRFPVRAGQRVESGQTIAEFNCAIESADYAIGVARKEAAEENLAVNQRLEELKSISNLDLSMSASEASVRRAELDRSAALLDHCVIEAPFSGTVTQKLVQAFQYVQKGEVLLELVDTENLEVEMVLPSIGLAGYSAGVQFVIDVDETGDRVNARVDRIVEVVDPISQTIRVIGVLVDPPLQLMPGMSGIVTF